MAISRVSLSSIAQGFPKSRSFLDGNSAYIPPSFESIATVNGTGSSNIITFSSIPSTYKHLQIRGITRDTGTSTSYVGFYININSDTAANYSQHGLYGDGTSSLAYGTANTTSIAANGSPGGGQLASVFGTVIIDLLDYANTNKYKTIKTLDGVNDNSTTTGNQIIELASGSWRSTSAITRIDLKAAQTAWATSSTFALYGIKG